MTEQGPAPFMSGAPPAGLPSRTDPRSWSPPLQVADGVVLANVHSHLRRHVQLGRLREPEPARFMPEDR